MDSRQGSGPRTRSGAVGGDPTFKVLSKNELAREGLPVGWLKEQRPRQNGSKTKSDPYYIDPITGYEFRSLKDVQRFIKSGDINKCFMKPRKRNIEDLHITENQSPTKLLSLMQRNTADKAIQCNLPITEDNKLPGKELFSTDGGVDTENALPPEPEGINPIQRFANHVEVSEKKSVPPVSTMHEETKSVTGKEESKVAVTPKKCKTKRAKRIATPLRASPRLAALKTKQEVNAEPEDEQLSVETDTANQSQPSQADTVNQSQPSQADAVNQSQPSQVDAVNQSQPSQVDTVNQSQPSQADTVYQSQPSQADTFYQSQPSQADTVYQSRPSQAETVNQSRPSQAETVYQLQPSQAETVNQSRPSQAETVNQSQPSQADTASQSHTNQENIANQLQINQAENPKPEASFSSVPEQKDEAPGTVSLKKVENQNSCIPEQVDGAPIATSSANVECLPKQAALPEPAADQSGPALSSLFGNAWSDPCIEFAFKTLTGDIPVLDDTAAVAEYFHQQQDANKGAAPNCSVSAYDGTRNHTQVDHVSLPMQRPPDKLYNSGWLPPQ